MLDLISILIRPYTKFIWKSGELFDKMYMKVNVKMHLLLTHILYMIEKICTC